MADDLHVLKRFEAALDQLEGDPELPLPGRNAGAFGALLPDLERAAATGDARCQAALATVLGFGLACRSEAEFQPQFESLVTRATSLWAAAAKQGYWPSFDNLFSSGIGKEEEAARAIAAELEIARSDLVGRAGSMPVYGPAFMEEACRRYAARAAQQDVAD